MQAVILAGGLGTRLRPLTYEVPKVLVPVAGRPFIEWLIESLPRDLFGEVLMLTGHLGEQVEQHCGDGSRYGRRLVYSQEPKPLGTAGALRHARDLLHEHFVLLNGDTYLALDYGELLDFHDRARTTGTMVLAKPHDPSIRSNVRVEPSGRVSRYAKGAPDPRLNGTDGGVAVFDRNVLRHIPGSGPSALEDGIFQALAENDQLAGYVTGHVYYDMGTDPGLRAMEAIMGPGGQSADALGSGR